MFKYITQILTLGQRILILLVSAILIIMLLLINSITKTCNELTVKLENQEQQIIQLNQRVFELNYQVSNEQMEIINIVEGMIEDVELSVKQIDKIEKWP
jgi:predicted PurR-regulated permease PerM